MNYVHNNIVMDVYKIYNIICNVCVAAGHRRDGRNIMRAILCNAISYIIKRVRWGIRTFRTVCILVWRMRRMDYDVLCCYNMGQVPPRSAAAVGLRGRRRWPAAPGRRRQRVRHFGGRPVLPVAREPFARAPVALHGQRALLVHLVQHPTPHRRPLGPVVVDAHSLLRRRPLSLPSADITTCVFIFSVFHTARKSRQVTEHKYITRYPYTTLRVYVRVPAAPPPATHHLTFRKLFPLSQSLYPISIIVPT